MSVTLRVTAHGRLAVLIGCRKPLVSTGWTISLLFSTNGHRNCSSDVCRGFLSDTIGSFQSAEVFAGQRALTVVSLLMSGCGQGHEPPEH